LFLHNIFRNTRKIFPLHFLLGDWSALRYLPIAEENLGLVTGYPPAPLLITGFFADEWFSERFPLISPASLVCPPSSRLAPLRVGFYFFSACRGLRNPILEFPYFVCPSAVTDPPITLGYDLTLFSGLLFCRTSPLIRRPISLSDLPS